MPANNRARSFLFWVADFLADPVVAAMSTEAVGAYVLLLCYAWQSDQRGTLANDDAMLASLTRMGPRWPEVREQVLRAFVVRGSLLVQKRMVEEAKATDQRLERARAHGAAGANMRWRKDMDRVGMPTPCETDSQPIAGAGMPVAVTETGEPPAAAIAAAPAPDAASNVQRALELVGSVAGVLAPARSAARVKAKPPTEQAWEWLQANAPERAKDVMQFVGWLVKTGTRDGDVVLALVKHYVVHKPNNPHAYYTPEGNARQAVAMRVGGDKAIAEHERLKREERAFLGRRK